MKYQITGKNIKITEGISAAIEKKLKKMENKESIFNGNPSKIDVSNEEINFF